MFFVNEEVADVDYAVGSRGSGSWQAEFPNLSENEFHQFFDSDLFIDESRETGVGESDLSSGFDSLYKELYSMEKQVGVEKLQKINSPNQSGMTSNLALDKHMDSSSSEEEHH